MSEAEKGDRIFNVMNVKKKVPFKTKRELDRQKRIEKRQKAKAVWTKAVDFVEQEVIDVQKIESTDKRLQKNSIFYFLSAIFFYVYPFLRKLQL